MATLVARTAEALEREGIPFCQWKGAGALARALRGERDVDGLVPAAAWPAALAAIERAGWKRALPRRGRDEPGVAHFFGFEPAAECLLHLHLHDRVLSGEDWINSHVLPFADELLASARHSEGVRVPEPASEAVLLLLKHAIRWGSWPDRVTALLRPKDESREIGELLAEPILTEALARAQRALPALDEATLRAVAAELRGERSQGGRPALAKAVRRALASSCRYRASARVSAYAHVGIARLRRLADRNRPQRVLAAGPRSLVLTSRDAARAERRAAELAAWLGHALRTLRFAGPAGAPGVAVGERPASVAIAAATRLDADALATPDALRAAAWRAL